MTNFPTDKFQGIETPFYYYDKKVLLATLDTIKAELAERPNYHLHYAIKANANLEVLKEIQKAGFGVDAVSGGEIQQALKAGFEAQKIVYAGVGKNDWEINLGLDAGIFCFNVESLEELRIINELAQKKHKTAKVCFRINPNVGAHTHANITTGLMENKFGIAMEDMELAIREAKELSNIEFIGLHFHIGSQILEMDDFAALANRVNELQDRLESQGIKVKNINVGGGLGIAYNDPDGKPVPDFKKYFDTYAQNLKLREGQQVHFELGRAVVGQMGSLITRILYVKNTHHKQFAIVDGGMSDLIRPALYDAHHKIQNISSMEAEETYDVVGPICESSDVFGKNEKLPKCHRGDLIALRSAGAYGEIMACQYNCRKLPKAYLM
ncbi:MAG: diaminopimelate decarboxylase [Prevotella sp.]|jgi:diaminopimelate decarboxylase|nr:diaminopimelate decarboxylase [Prevotella sp.]